MSQLAERTGETKPAPYTSEQIADLVVGSFRLSRGDGGIQKQFLVYLGRNFGGRILQGLEQGDLSLVESARQVIDKATDILTNEQAHPTTSARMGSEFRTLVEKETELAFGALTIAVEGQGSLFEIEDLTRYLLSLDKSWLAKKDKTPIPFKSNVIHYGLLGRSTGFEEYDQLFREVAEAVKEGLGNGGYFTDSLSGHHEFINLGVMARDYAARFPQRAEELQTLGLLSRE